MHGVKEVEIDLGPLKPLLLFREEAIKV